MALICRSASPVAITMRSVKAARPARSITVTFSALSSSRLVTMTACTRSSTDGSAVLRTARGLGPAAAAFLRGVPGTFAASFRTVGGLGVRRLTGGFAPASGPVGFLAIVLLPHCVS